MSELDPTELDKAIDSAIEWLQRKRKGAVAVWEAFREAKRQRVEPSATADNITINITN